jgi:hypothetical protein
MPVKIEHRVGVKAPASVVWEILSDLPAWSEWNPVYTEAAGLIRYGERLTLTEALPGAEPRILQAAIVDWAPDEALHLRGSALGGWVKTIRFLEIDTLSETGCAFSNGELFTGALAPFLPRKTRRQLRAAFAALGEAVRDRAETRWRERSVGTT